MVDIAKIEAVEELREKFSRARIAVFADFRGLTVAQISELRNRLRAEQVEFRVIKNTIARRAVADTPWAAATEFFEGPTSMALSYDDAVVPAKVLANFAKEEKVFELKGGLLDGQALDAGAVRKLADLPPREVLQSQLLSALQGPAVGLVGVLQRTVQSFLGTLKTYADTKS